MLEKSSLTYTRLFCEENIWKLVETLQTDAAIQAIDVLFIINDDNTVALFDQQAAEPGTVIIWDYHVILCASQNHQYVIYDFDSRCPFPCEIKVYFDQSFNDWHHLQPEFRPMIRRISARDYLQHFSSDRHHMLGQITNENFPAYPVIKPGDVNQAITLQQYWDINATIDNSEILTPYQYLDKLLALSNP